MGRITWRSSAGQQPAEQEQALADRPWLRIGGQLRPGPHRAEALFQISRANPAAQRPQLLRGDARLGIERPIDGAHRRRT
ncbi:MAG: hypothetical protein HC822_24115, partial [Oscillochloris sp.]|nr:hypothetical protein [Oscillochloris sp.]